VTERQDRDQQARMVAATGGHYAAKLRELIAETQQLAAQLRDTYELRNEVEEIGAEIGTSSIVGIDPGVAAAFLVYDRERDPTMGMPGVLR